VSSKRRDDRNFSNRTFADSSVAVVIVWVPCSDVASRRFCAVLWYFYLLSYHLRWNKSRNVHVITIVSP
jgi:hypothetical protein